jgi:UDP-N-acetyl-D-glucosamine dehydrogenase
MRRYDLKMESVPFTPESLASYDCVVISTHHSSYNWQDVADHAKLIVDTRNAMKGVKGRRDHIIGA